MLNGGQRKLLSVEEVLAHLGLGKAGKRNKVRSDFLVGWAKNDGGETEVGVPVQGGGVLGGVHSRGGFAKGAADQGRRLVYNLKMFKETKDRRPGTRSAVTSGLLMDALLLIEGLLAEFVVEFLKFGLDADKGGLKINFGVLGFC